jgi:WD40 repeat protein
VAATARASAARLKAKDLPPAVQGMHACVHAPTAKLFAAPGESNSVHVWDTETGEERSVLELGAGKGDYLRELAVSSDGRMLASLKHQDAPRREVVQLWDVKTGKVVHTLAKDQEYLANVALSPDGKTLATIGWNDVRFWDTASGKERCRAKGVANFGVRVAFSPDSRTLLSMAKMPASV